MIRVWEGNNALYRSSHRWSVKRLVLKSSQNLQENTCAWVSSLFFNKVAGLNPVILFRMKLRHRCFFVNFAKFLRMSYFETSLVAASEYDTKLSFSHQTLTKSFARINCTIISTIFGLNMTRNNFSSVITTVSDKIWKYFQRNDVGKFCHNHNTFEILYFHQKTSDESSPSG